MEGKTLCVHHVGFGTRDMAKARVSSAIANLDEAKLNYSYTKVVSPIDGIVSRKYQQGGDEPVVFFPMTGKDASARAYCNLHGLWKG